MSYKKDFILESATILKAIGHPIRVQIIIALSKKTNMNTKHKIMQDNKLINLNESFFLNKPININTNINIVKKISGINKYLKRLFSISKLIINNNLFY